MDPEKPCNQRSYLACRGNIWITKVFKKVENYFSAPLSINWDDLNKVIQGPRHYPSLKKLAWHTRWTTTHAYYYLKWFQIKVFSLGIDRLMIICYQKLFCCVTFTMLLWNERTTETCLLELKYLNHCARYAVVTMHKTALKTALYRLED